MMTPPPPPKYKKNKDILQVFHLNFLLPLCGLPVFHFPPYNPYFCLYRSLDDYPCCVNTCISLIVVHDKEM